MDRVMLKEKLQSFFKKYKYVALVLAVGLVLMLLPSQKKTASDQGSVVQPTESAPSVQEQLSQILSQINGAGKVQVMLTVASGEEIIYQTNDDFETNNDTGSTRADTVTVTDAERNESGLIRQVNPPAYLGALVVCQGADSPTVRFAIADAVTKITGLGADKISILKMK